MHKALDAFNTSIKLRENNELAFMMRGATYQTMENWDSALADYSKAIELNGQDALAYYRRSQIYNEQKKEAQEKADKDKFNELYAVMSKPESAAEFYDRARYFEDRGFWEDAITNYSGAIQKDPALKIGLPASSVYERRGDIYLAQVQVTEALQDYNKAIEIQPQRADLLLKRADLLYDYIGDEASVQQAEKDYTAVIARATELANKPDVLVRAYRGRGDVYIALNEADKAISDFSEALKLDPQNMDVIFDRGLAYDNKGDADNALKDYSRVIELDPEQAAAYNNRGSIYADKEDWAKALPDFVKASALSADNVMFISNRGIANWYLKNYDKAVADFTEAIKLAPEAGITYERRAAVYRDMGKTKEAEADEKKAEELNAAQAAKENG
jgi:tetratricopeptide (TPR) repeat protein